MLRDSFYYWSCCLKSGCRCCRTRSTCPADCNTAVGAAGLVLLPVPRPAGSAGVVRLFLLLAIRLPVLRDTFYYWSCCLKYGSRCCRTRSTGPVRCNTAGRAAGLVLLMVSLFEYRCRGCRSHSTGPAACNTAVGAARLVLLAPLLAIRLPVLRDSFMLEFAWVVEAPCGLCKVERVA